jgi:hypothetical protein
VRVGKRALEGEVEGVGEAKGKEMKVDLRKKIKCAYVLS